MTVIGVTGTFCTGKTTVAAFFKKLGAQIIDADKIVHQLYKKDKRIKSAILQNFGREAFKRGRIDRRKLGKIIFSSKRSLNKLCRIVHPKVIKKIKEKAKRSAKSVIVIDAPLLIEAGLYKFVDYTVVVKANLTKQIERGVGKGFRKCEVLLRCASQKPLQEKIKIADFVIDNNRSKSYTRKEVTKVWKELRGGAKNGQYRY